jgi:hypothetical protein
MEQKQEVSKYQNFQIERVCRSEIVGAEYNPRKISDAALGRLKKTIKKIGMVQPPVWNKRTGRLVGGHQRLSVLDMLHGSGDYWLDVAVIDVDDKTEVQTNLALNNEAIMGDFDLDLMGDLKEKFDLGETDFKAVGFTDADLDLMFDGDFSERFFEDDKEVVEAKEKIKEVKAARAGAKDKFKESLTDEFFFVVVCDSKGQKEELLKKLKVPPFETYISSEKIITAIKQ